MSPPDRTVNCCFSFFLIVLWLLFLEQWIKLYIKERVVLREIHLRTTRRHLSNRITQCYLLPDRGGCPAFTPTGQVGTRFMDPIRMKPTHHATVQQWSMPKLYLSKIAIFAPVRGSSSEYCHKVKKTVWENIYSFRQNARTWQTDRQTDGHRTTAWGRARYMLLLMCTIILFSVFTTTLYRECYTWYLYLHLSCT